MTVDRYGASGIFSSSPLQLECIASLQCDEVPGVFSLCPAAVASRGVQAAEHRTARGKASAVSSERQFVPMCLRMNIFRRSLDGSGTCMAEVLRATVTMVGQQTEKGSNTSSFLYFEVPDLHIRELNH